MHLKIIGIVENYGRRVSFGAIFGPVFGSIFLGVGGGPGLPPQISFLIMMISLC
jgi:hypothetical protein